MAKYRLTDVEGEAAHSLVTELSRTAPIDRCSAYFRSLNANNFVSVRT